MKATHTPGPWRVEDGTRLIWGRCDPDDRSTYGMGYPIMNAEYHRSWGGADATGDEMDANAVLVAAAPDLLEALEKCPLPSTMGSVATHYTRFYDWYQAIAVPAIRKAGGIA